MKKETVTISKDRVASSGRHGAQRAALQDVQHILASMIEDVRGDDEVTIEIYLTKKKSPADAKSGSGEQKPAAKTAEKSGSSAKPKAKTSSSSKPKRKRPSRAKSAKSVKPEQKVVEPSLPQEDDPLAKVTL